MIVNPDALTSVLNYGNIAMNNNPTHAGALEDARNAMDYILYEWLRVLPTISTIYRMVYITLKEVKTVTVIDVRRLRNYVDRPNYRT